MGILRISRGLQRAGGMWITSRPASADHDTDARLQVAEAADAAGNTDLAALLYTQAAADQTSNIALQLRCADALARSGKVAQAREMLTARLRATASQPDLLRALALINLVSGESEQAMAGFDQLLLVKPDDAGALVDKAVALDLQGQHTAAQTLYRQVLAKSPDDAATKNDLAVSMMLEGRIQQALETLSPMQKAETLPPRVRAKSGILYSAAGDVDSRGDFWAISYRMTISRRSPRPVTSQALTSQMSQP